MILVYICFVMDVYPEGFNGRARPFSDKNNNPGFEIPHQICVPL